MSYLRPTEGEDTDLSLVNKVSYLRPTNVEDRETDMSSQKSDLP